MDSPLLPVAGVAAIATVGAYYALSGGESPVAAARRDLSGVVNPDPATLSPYARAETKFFTAPDAEGTLRLAKKGVASLKPTTVSRKKEKRFFFSFFSIIFFHFFPLCVACTRRMMVGFDCAALAAARRVEACA
jgi:hypothetical protein